jgi:OmcA/MtrC family decaheme c-type cytochrome
MRAVAIQSYFTQTAALDEDGDGVLDNIGRHTPSVVMAVPGDAVRRTVVKSGYDSVTGQPFGCLECHETLELHGGSRVNNPQVCVFCHNPNKSSSGRTVDPSLPSSAIDELGGSPLDFPEATNNLKNMVHGIHRASDRPYEFVRNRQNGIYYNWSHVTFPGDLRYCEKCHIENTYRPENLPAGVLWNTVRTTTGNPSETRADIIAARASVPNSTDLVDSPIAGACYYCHDSALTKSHFLQNGGTIGSIRGDEFTIIDLSP